jgi:hypothetical protein
MAALPPCGLTREELKERNRIDADDLCTAKYGPKRGDGSYAVCGEPYANHRAAAAPASSAAAAHGENGSRCLSFFDCSPRTQKSWVAFLMIVGGIGIIAASYVIAFHVADPQSSLSVALASVATTAASAFIYSFGSTFKLCCERPAHVEAIIAAAGVIVFIAMFPPAFFVDAGPGKDFLFSFSINVLVSAAAVIYFETLHVYLKEGCCLVSRADQPLPSLPRGPVDVTPCTAHLKRQCILQLPCN